MPAITIRNLPEEIHHSLKALAASHGQSAEAEVRAILAAAEKPAHRLKMGKRFGRWAGMWG